jgi:zinc transporter 1/2/3
MAAGIFIGAGLIHMLPDAVVDFGIIAPHLGYPLASLLCAVGFVLILFIEGVLVPGGEERASSPDTADQRPAYPFVLTLILSIHSILAGIALGAEPSFISSLAIFIAIVGHKGSAGFALAVSLQRTEVGRRAILNRIVFFSLMTPLGIGIGSVFVSLLTGTTSLGFEAVFDSLAAGSFIYISAVDIIKEEFFEPYQRWFKFALLCLGLGLMAMLALWL